MDRSLQGSSVHGIFQARVLEWVAIYFSKRDKVYDIKSPSNQQGKKVDIFDALKFKTSGQ